MYNKTNIKTNNKSNQKLKYIIIRYKLRFKYL